MAKITTNPLKEGEELDLDFTKKFPTALVLGKQKYKTHRYNLTYVQRGDTKKLVVGIEMKDDFYDNASNIKEFNRSRKMKVTLHDGSTIDTHQDEYLSLFRKVTNEPVEAIREEWVEGQGAVSATFDWEGNEVTLPAVLLNA